MGTMREYCKDYADAYYGRVWEVFEARVRGGEGISLSSCCRSAGIKCGSMRAWASRRGLSVWRLRRSVLSGVGQPTGFTGRETPPCGPEAASGVTVVFPDGVSLTLHRCTPEEAAAFVDTYERRRSAGEAACSP